MSYMKILYGHNTNVFVLIGKHLGLKGFTQNILYAAHKAIREKAIQIGAFYRSYMKTGAVFKYKRWN